MSDQPDLSPVAERLAHHALTDKADAAPSRRRSISATLIIAGIVLMVLALCLPLRTPNWNVPGGVFIALFITGPTLAGAGLGLLIRWPVLGALIGMMLSIPLLAACLLMLGG